MFVEQAIFTSVRSGRNEGYQIAAASPGVTIADKRELAQWGPGHDALYDTRPTAESINCHRMENGLHCLSRTVYAGREYSGRGGYRVYTQCFLVPENLLHRFSHHPFRVMEALVVSGRASVLTPIPDQLAPASIVGRAGAVKTAEVERLCQTLGPEKLASLVCAALKTDVLGVSAPVPPATSLRSAVGSAAASTTRAVLLVDHRSESIATPPVPPGRASRRSGRTAAGRAAGAPHGARSACGPAGQVCGAQRLAVVDL